jgi:hypothetical protein
MKTLYRAHRANLAVALGATALFVSLGGPGYAASLIDGSKLKNRSVGAKKLKRNSVTSAKIRTGAVRSGELRNNKVRSVDIRDATISLADLAADVTQAIRVGIRNGSVGTAHLADRAVTGEKLAAGAVSSGKLANDSVTGVKILTGTITGGDLADNSVTDDEVALNALSAADLDSDSVNAAEIAAGAVRASDVQDNSLRISDVSTLSGSVTVNFEPIAPHSCVANEPSLGDVQLGDAIVAVTAAANLPYQSFAVYGQQGSPANTIRIVVCNVTAAEQNPPPVVYRYAVFDA